MYLFGLAVTGFIFIKYLIKSLCTAPFALNQGEIISHIFAIKTCSLVLFPVFSEYINYCYGFMTADLPWANSFYTNYLAN
jgi:hypothetical protein